jgi:HAD superfamily hydrolase (TIGR01509 family)
VIAVVFDFDGVLVDTEPLHLAAFQEAFVPRGWALDDASYAARYLGYDDLDLIRTFADDHGFPLGADEVDELARRKGQAFRSRLSPADVLYPGAAACVARLAARFPLAIASGSLHAEIVHILEGAGLRAPFRAIVGADDVERSKPAPDSYVRAAALLGVPPDRAVAVEDSPWGLEAARAAGLRTIAVTTTSPAASLAAADRVLPGLGDLTVDLVLRLVGDQGA